MIDIKKYCLSILDFSQEELNTIEHYFKPFRLDKKKYLLEEGDTCDFIAFISDGCIRHFHTKDGNQFTCDLSFEGSFITEFNSFNNSIPSKISLQALENTKLLLIKKVKLTELYQLNAKFENFGRNVAEKVAMRNTEIAMSLASEKPEIRYVQLLASEPEIFLRVPQKYIANFLGLTPESLSRIRKRVQIKEKS